MQPALTTTRMDFHGSALGLFFRYLLVIFCSFLIIPYPWFAVLFIAWFIGNLDFGGRTAGFFGECKEVWWMFVLMALFAMYPNYLSWATDMDVNAPGKFWSINFIVNLINVVIGYYLLIWIVSRIRLEDGETLEFTGGLWGLLWRNYVIILLVFTVIGWAWGATMLLRWIARNIRGPKTVLSFEGSGWGLLWRSFIPLLIIGFSVGALASGIAAQKTPEPNIALIGVGGILCLGCILALPWYLRWLTRWLVASTYVHQAKSTGMSRPAEAPGTTPPPPPPAAEPHAHEDGTGTAPGTERTAETEDFGFEEPTAADDSGKKE